MLGDMLEREEAKAIQCNDSVAVARPAIRAKIRATKAARFWCAATCRSFVGRETGDAASQCSMATSRGHAKR